MNLYWSKEFLNKVIMPYPLKIFDIQLIRTLVENEDNWNGKIDPKKLQVNSTTFHTDTVPLNDGTGYSLGFKFRGEALNEFRWIILIGYDLLKDGSLSESYDVDDTGTIAGIVDLDSIRLANDVAYKLILPLPTGIKSSNRQLLIGRDKDNSTTHYTDTLIGAENFNSITDLDLSIIDGTSGRTRLREGMSRMRALDLNGCMTIKQSGIIQL